MQQFKELKSALNAKDTPLEELGDSRTHFQETKLRAKKLVEQQTLVTIGLLHGVKEDGFGTPLYKGRHNSHELVHDADSKLFTHIALTTFSSSYGNWRSDTKLGRRSLRHKLCRLMKKFIWGKCPSIETEFLSR